MVQTDGYTDVASALYIHFTNLLQRTCSNCPQPEGIKIFFSPSCTPC
jgi:hypothetical protein